MTRFAPWFDTDDDASDGPLLSPRAWGEWAACRGRTELFYSRHAESFVARQRREAQASELCMICPVLGFCRAWAREHREYGFWGGESEEGRTAAGYPVALPVGRVAELRRSLPVELRDGGRHPGARASYYVGPRGDLRRYLMSRTMRAKTSPVTQDESAPVQS